jgi:NADP-reducing hydrogenase subunit HndD
MSAVPLEPPRRLIDVEIDGETVRVPEGATILDACRAEGVDTPTLCYAENLTPVNACRVCVVEVEGARTLVPACSRAAEDGMKVKTDTERVQLSRRLVMEFLASSVEMDLVNADVHRWMDEYAVHPARFGAEMEPLAAGERDARAPGHHHESADPSVAEAVYQPVKIDNELYVRDYSRCILCYKCVEACGVDAQNTFAIAVAGRGFDARISTEYAVGLDASACVYCGNCIGVCPTGALMFTSEHDMRAAGTWDEEQQSVTSTICPYCGVGCQLDVHVQDNSIVKVTSPSDNYVTSGHLCVKGRFGYQFVQRRKRREERD